MEKDLVRLNYIRVLLIYCNAHDDITISKFKESIRNGKSAKTSKMKYYFSLKWNSFNAGKIFWENEILKQFGKLFLALLYNLVMKIGKLILIGKLHSWFRLWRWHMSFVSTV